MASTRSCPVCGEQDCVPFVSENIDQARIKASTYASRKDPEFMRLRLVRCRKCDVAYAPSPPSRQFLSQAYAEADYDSRLEAAAAARTYAQELARHLASIPHRNAAIDVGAGSGPLLPWLQQQAFEPVLGIEPSKAAIAAAPPATRPMLLEGVFDAALVREHQISLICSFMTLEHLLDPYAFAHSAFTLLLPGGALALVVHDRNAWLNRLLWTFSPIFDIEHVQLFNRPSLTALLQRAGFVRIRVVRLRNVYPLRYWLRLMPLPSVVKGIVLRWLRFLRLDQREMALNVGNVFAIGYRPG